MDASRLYDSYESREFARRVYINELTGDHEVECYAEDGNGSCRARPGGWQLGPWENRDAFLRVEDPLPPGDHYLLLDARMESHFRLVVNFSKEIWIGEPILLPDAGSFFAPELFEGPYIDIERIGSVTWGGTVLDGTMPMDFKGYGFAAIHLNGHALASWARFCVVQGEREECPTPNVAPIPTLRLDTVLDASAGAAHFTLSAASAAREGMQGTGSSNFYVGGEVIRFDLPARHPAAT